MERLTEHRGKGTIIVDMGKYHESAIRRLAAIEDILRPDYNLDRLRALMEADRDGLVRIARRPPLENECCGNCGHFQRITGTARGDCAVREYTRKAMAREIHTLPVPKGVPAISKEDR